MPNWCENTLIVSGDKKQIKQFKEKAKGKKNKTDLSLNNFVPLSKELENTTAPSLKPNKKLIKKYGADNWYEWCISNWGTKWDVEATLEDEEEYL